MRSETFKRLQRAYLDAVAGSQEEFDAGMVYLAYQQLSGEVNQGTAIHLRTVHASRLRKLNNQEEK